MKLDKEVRHEIRIMALGCLICTVLIILGFVAVSRFDYTVVTGGAVGWLLAFGNFFFMARGVAKALETGDENTAKLKMRSSYIARTIAMIAVMAVSLVVNWMHWLPVIASVFYPRIVITAQNLINLVKSRKKHLAGEDEAEQEAAKTEINTQNDTESDEEEHDAMEIFMKSFYKGTVPGENINKDAKK